MTEQEKSNLSWWTEPQINSGLDYYLIPACDFAEHRFLNFLLFLLLNPIQTTQHRRPQSVTLHSHDLKKEVDVACLQKMPHIILNDGKNFKFGRDTYLVLNGPFAGTIANWIGKSKDGTTKLRIQAIRPLVETPIIQEKIKVDISYQPDRHLIDLLNKTNDLITQKGGYLQALFYLLDQLEIEANKTAIVRNNQILQKAMKKI